LQQKEEKKLAKINPSSKTQTAVGHYLQVLKISLPFFSCSLSDSKTEDYNG